MAIINYYQVSERIASSGQPAENDFQEIAALGYNTVINLALVTSEKAIINEGDIVTNLGLSYIHIPVLWNNPTQEQFNIFASIMQQQSTNKVWVHCALNMRVSAFLYLYNIIYLNMPKEAAEGHLSNIWKPNEVWSEFITNGLNSASRSGSVN